MKQGALMLCALGPEPAIEALRLGPLHTVDNGVFVVFLNGCCRRCSSKVGVIRGKNEDLQQIEH